MLIVSDYFFAYAILKRYSIAEPSFVTYLLFTFSFILAKFSVAAVLARGIIVMLPILEQYLHFTPDMASLITMLYMLFDPIITTINIMENGALAKMINNLFSSLRNGNYGIQKS